MWKKIMIFIMCILFLCVPDYGYATESDVVKDLQKSLIEIEKAGKDPYLIKIPEGTPESDAAKVLQEFSVEVEEVGNNKISLGGDSYLVEISKYGDSSVDTTYVVSYVDENGERQTAYRREGETAYYNLETNEEVKIIFSEDISNGNNADGYIADSYEFPVNEHYFVKYDITISFPEEVTYKGEKVKDIVIEGQKLDINKHSRDELENTWRTEEIYIGDMLSFSDSGEKYIPIVICTDIKSITCKYYVDGGGSELRTSIGGGTSFQVVHDNNYSSERKYFVGDSLGNWLARACKHEITETSVVRTGTTSVTSDPVVYASVWVPEAGWDHSYGETVYNKPPEGATLSGPVENTSKSFDCTNGAYQRYYEYTYTETKEVPVYETVTVKVGEKNCAVNVKFKGFRATGYPQDFTIVTAKGGRGVSLSDEDIIGEGRFIIDESSFNPNVLAERMYDSSKGLYYGTITFSCSGVDKVYKVYFSPFADWTYSLSYYASPSQGGNVPDGKVFTEADIGKGVIEKYEATANPGYRFEKWRFEYYDKKTGKLINAVETLDSSGEFKMSKYDVKAIAYFNLITPPSRELTVYIIGHGEVKLDGDLIENGHQLEVTKGQALKFEANNVTVAVKKKWVFLFWEGEYEVESKWKFNRYASNLKDPISTNRSYTHTVGDEDIIYVYFNENSDGSSKDIYSVEYADIPQGAASSLPKSQTYSFDEYYDYIEGFYDYTPELWVEANDGYEFDYWEFITDTGAKVNANYDENTGKGTFKMIKANVLAIAHFKEVPKADEGYTLYVTSNNGGTAWTDGNENHSDVQEITSGLPDGKIMYKIENVKPGEKFKIQYKLEDNEYEFGFWEYKPFIKPDDESGNAIEITMPRSDLTVTAIFKNDDIKKEPALSVTTNNPEWGTAWTIIDGKRTVVGEKYKNVDIGGNYTIYYEPNPGYYFINYNHSTSETPFISDDVIKMPNKDLEIMAMFAPIPAKGPEGHKITFEAEPPEGGKVPDDTDLVNVLPGGKVTIAVTPNKGWEFDYWRFENSDGEIVYLVAEYDPITGTGYFVMPDYDVVAIAVFKESEKNYYKLYVTYYYGGTAWTYDNDGTVTNYVEKAYVGESYPLILGTTEENYEFDHWEFRWDKYGTVLSDDDIDPTQMVDKGFAVMPKSDMTVTAIFKEIVPTAEPILMVSTNNPKWGDAWVVVDGAEYHSEWVSVEAEKEYEVYYKPNSGYEFTNWSTEDYFTEYTEGVFRAIIKMPNEKLELMAFFKPGNENENEFTLIVSADPKNGGTVKIKNAGTLLTNVVAGTQCRVIATSNEDYEFRYWYIIKDGKKIAVSDTEVYDFRMPSEDRELIAYFKKCTDGESGYNYELTVSVDPIDAGISKIEGYGEETTVEVSPDSIVTVNVIPSGKIIESNGYKYEYVFDGWYEDNLRVWEDEKFEFVMEKDRYLVAKYKEKLIGEPEIEVNKDSFRIVSVRDLNWKNYFTSLNGTLTGKYFSVPTENETMLQDVYVSKNEKYNKTIKTGYAVEFELDTISVPAENAYLKITPQIVNGGKVYDANDKNSIYEGLSGKKIENYFLEPIIIYANPDNDPNKSNNAYTSFMATSSTSDNIFHNGINQHFITWKWLYYLPAEIDSNKFTDSNKVTIRFKIELFADVPGTSNDIKQLDLVTYYNNGGSSWKGNVFEYSLKHSLLEDIYNNAQN